MFTLPTTDTDNREHGLSGENKLQPTLQQTQIIYITDLTKKQQHNKRVCWRLSVRERSVRPVGGGNARDMLLPTADIKQHEEEATERSGSEHGGYQGERFTRLQKKITGA